ncbi:NTP transferase domain-containing protein [Desulfosarcina sp.]|uniref:NTP transferase domain-containing protein n=1 Tax=Desulfosarcina sp. TaxID=2027861 RepID=UPI003970557F
MTLTDPDPHVASIIMVAGRGSRMQGYDGNKTLLPLVPGSSVFIGGHPIVMHLMNNLPAGPRALVVNHCKDQVMKVTRGTGAVYCEQPVLNGTGGAILAAGEFVNAQRAAHVIITMGDVPFVQKRTFDRLVVGLKAHELMILGFSPKEKKQYGMLEIEKGQVRKITEWKYWKDYPTARQQALTVCNSGIYAVRRSTLADYLPILASRPQIVQKHVNNRMTDIEEFFFTDLIEFMVQDGKRVGFHVVDDEFETMGIDDVAALIKAQAIYQDRIGSQNPA